MTLRVEVPGEKVVNIESCKCKPYEGENNKSDQKINGRIKEFIKKTWALRSKVTVEPFVICYVLPSVLAGLAVQNLCLEKSCLVNLKYDQDTCSHIMDGRTFNYTEQEKNVQKMVASMTAWSFPLQTALPGILTLFVGSWSDRTGNRKSFMVLPILGKLIACFGVILSTIFFLKVGLNETALIEGLPPALAGGRVAMTMAVYSYVTDITSDSERTFRLGIITAILTLSRPIGLALSGIMTRRFGYYGVFVTACVFYLTGFVYILLRLKVKKKKSIDKQESQTVLSMFSVKDLAATVNVAFKTRQGSRRLQIILVMFAYMFIVGPVLEIMSSKFEIRPRYLQSYNGWSNLQLHRTRKNVQKMVASITAWGFPLQTALTGILMLFMGSWSDRTRNRKMFMVLPIFGKLIACFGLILSTIFFLKVGLNETALIDGVIPALVGGRVAMTMAVYSYITDITSNSERTFRLGIITAILTLSRPIGLALSGIMTRRFGYYGVFSVVCVFYLTGFVYIILRLKNKKKKSLDKEESETVLSLFSIKDLVATVNVAFKTRRGSRRLQIILVIIAYMLSVGPVLGEAQMTYWFTRYKFKFTEVDYSLFLTYSVLVGTIGSFITIYLLSKRWNIEDSIIGMVACVSRIAASLVYAMAPTRTVYFLGPVLDMFSSAGATSLRSIATKLVQSDEVGKASSLISISEALVPVIYSPVYTKVYLSTLSTFSGAFYLISAALAVPAILVYITLFILRKRDIEESKMNAKQDIKQETNQESKDNEITRC